MRRPAEKRVRETSDQNDDMPSPKRTRSATPKRAGSDLQVEPDMSQYADLMATLENELQKENPKGKRVRRAMKDTFAGRRKWIQDSCPPVSDIIDKFPLLKESKYVSCTHL